MELTYVEVGKIAIPYRNVEALDTLRKAYIASSQMTVDMAAPLVASKLESK